MSRPLRLEFSGALYHVTSRGNERKPIYREEKDFELFFDILGEACERFNWVVHAYCLMTNHYHLLVETPDANLSKGMRHLNGVYTQKFNRLYKRVGHLFQGRYKAILVQKEAYLLELSRYIVLNPVRAKGLVDSPDEWPWSSYLATIGQVENPKWLAVDALLRSFSNKRQQAVSRYVEFVQQGKGVKVWDQLKSQVFLGNDEFVNHHLQQLKDEELAEVPAKQRRGKAQPIESYVDCNKLDSKQGMAEAYLSGGYSMSEIARAFDVHYSTVSRAVAQCKT